jgi:hypothetical protein
VAAWDAPAARVCCDTRGGVPDRGGCSASRRHNDAPGRHRRLLGSPGSCSVHPAGLSDLVRQLGRWPRPDDPGWRAVGPDAGWLVSRPLRHRGAGDLEPGAGHPARRGRLVAPARLARRRPDRSLQRRRERIDRTRALTRAQVERLFARRDLPLRERTLWRLLYETAARANELLALDAEDLDLANRRARVHSKGARSSGCSGRPGRRSTSPACWPAGPADRSSWATAGQPARSPASTWTRPAGGRGCRTGGRPNCSRRGPGGHCTSYATRRSPTPPRTACPQLQALDNH